MSAATPAQTRSGDQGKRAAAAGETDDDDLVLDESGPAPKTTPGNGSTALPSSASAPSAPSASAVGPVIVTASHVAEAKTLAEAALSEREGHALVEKYVEGTPLVLNDETFLAPYAKRFAADNAPSFEGAAPSKLLALEIWLLKLDGNVTDVRTDLACQCLQKHIFELESVLQQAELIALHAQLVKGPPGPATGTVLMSDSFSQQTAAVSAALASVTKYDGIKQLTSAQLTTRQRQIISAAQGHGMIVDHALIRVVETTLEGGALGWSQQWRGANTSAAWAAYWEAFSTRFSAQNSHMEKIMSIFTVHPQNADVGRAAGSFVQYVLHIVATEEQAEIARVKASGGSSTGWSDQLKLGMFLNAARSIPKLYMKLYSKKLTTLQQAAAVSETELKKIEHKDNAGKIKLDLLACLCASCCGLHQTDACKIGPGALKGAKAKLKHKDFKPRFDRMAAVVTDFLDIESDETYNGVVAALQRSYEPKTGSFHRGNDHGSDRKRQKQAGRGRGQDGSRGGRGTRGRGRGSFGRGGRGAWSAQHRNDRHQPNSNGMPLTNEEFAAVYAIRANKPATPAGTDGAAQVTQPQG